MAEALGGTISISQSAPDLGCTFVISFLASAQNLIPASKSEKPLASSTEIPLDGLLVLLVDDSLDNQFLVRRKLETYGARVDVASDGIEAVEKALSKVYDVVLMDIQMPRMDGYQAMNELIAKKYARPVIALTAHAMAEERMKTKAAGFDGHLTKPLDCAELVNTIENLKSNPNAN